MGACRLLKTDVYNKYVKLTGRIDLEMCEMCTTAPPLLRGLRAAEGSMRDGERFVVRFRFGEGGLGV